MTKDQRFQGPVTVAQAAEVWTQWERIYGPRLIQSPGMQQAAREDLFSYTGTLDLTLLTNTEARLYVALLKTRPSYQAVSEAAFDKAMARF